jgi:hypothetical protein
MVIILENARFTDRGRMWVERLKIIAVELMKAIMISSPLGILMMLMFESRYVVSKVRMWEQRCTRTALYLLTTLRDLPIRKRIVKGERNVMTSRSHSWEDKGSSP